LTGKTWLQPVYLSTQPPESLIPPGHGYQQRETLRRFQLVRQIKGIDDGPPIDVIVDFLMPKDAVIVKNKPPLIDDFAVQRASGAELALQFNELVAISGTMPGGGPRRSNPLLPLSGRPGWAVQFNMVYLPPPPPPPPLGRLACALQRQINAYC